MARKITGGRYHSLRKKKLHEKDSQARLAKLGKEKRNSRRARSGIKKHFLLTAEFASIFSKGKSRKAKIKNVIETPSNKFLARQNIITKGSIIETEIGKARVTNRPSREGGINAVLIE